MAGEEQVIAATRMVRGAEIVDHWSKINHFH
jgi:hypothetical protein